MINEDTILEIIDSFYKKANHDIMIGYHFRVIEDFEEHIPRIADFWNLQLNKTMKDKSHLPFNLLQTHQVLKINRGEVFRWVRLFTDTLDEFILMNKLTQKEKLTWLEKVSFFEERILQMTNR